MNDVFDNFAESVRLFRDADPSVNQKVFTLTCIAPQRAASTSDYVTTSAFLNIGGEGDFLIQRVQGSAQGPVNASGVRILSGASTSFPIPGTNITGGFSGKGLRMRIKDVMNGTTLTNDSIRYLNPDPWMDVNAYLSPGYGMGNYYSAMLHEYFIPANGMLQFEFQNMDFPSDSMIAPAYHRIDISVIGKRYV